MQLAALINATADHEKVNILMVDDQPSKLLTYEAILGELGENLIKASSGKEALDCLLKNDVAVVLMDVSMPDMDGFEIAEIIRQHPRFQRTAIIFISAVHLTELDRLKGYQRGAVDYISVPVVPEVLRAKVSIFSELHRKTRQLESLNRSLEQRVQERTQELQDRETQFRTLANSIPQLAWMADKNGSVFWYNERWYNYTGANAKELDGDEWQKFYDPGHLPRVIEGLGHSIQTGEQWEDTHPIRGKDGTYRWFLSRSVPIRDMHGQVVRWFGTSTDISRQIAAEEQIRNLNKELNQRVTELETIMQVLPVGVAVAHDRECKFVTGNAALSQMLDIDPGENISVSSGAARRLPFSFFHEGEEVSQGELPMQRAARTGNSVAAVELDIHLASGKVTHTLVSASPLFDENRQVRGAVGVLFDVTERRQMEETLRVRADLLDLASEAIMVRDWDGAIRFWNAGAEALYGWKRHEVLGRNVHEILRTAYPVSAEEVETAIMRSGRWEGNVVQHAKDNSELIVASRQAAKVHDAGITGLILEINRDITAQLQAEEALRKTEKMAAVGRFAGVIAHEINNPLEAITNLFFLLRNHPSLDSEGRQYARMAEEELVRIGHITKQTLSFYRESQHPVPVSLTTLLDEVLELHASRFRSAGITLHRSYGTDGRVFGFPAELKQVFLNLVENSIHAMPHGGRLRIHIFHSTDRGSQRPGVTISVSDTGTGINPDHAKRLFEPFFTTKSTKGTGLGLWISRGIIQKHEGKIRFRTMRGMHSCTTCFSVFLPKSELISTPANVSTKQSVASV